MLPTLCAEASEHVREPLAGTAAFATTWILLEEHGPWAPKVLDSPGLSELRPVLERWLSEIPNARVQLIRRPDRDPAQRCLFVAEPARRQLRRLDAGDLSQVNLRDGEPVDEDLFFVCTHGKRDRCCAVRGTKLFTAMDAHAGERVWQTSHLGGHRFAATMLSLPHGYCLGRVQPDEAEAIVAARGLHDLQRLRGRVCYRPAVQAAEAALRQSQGLNDVDGVLVSRIGHDETTWTVKFTAGDTNWKVTVQPEITGSLRPKSCGAELSAVEVFPAVIERT